MKYSIISEFDAYGKHLYVVKVGENVHIMEEKEIKFMFGSWHPERWKKNKTA